MFLSPLYCYCRLLFNCSGPELESSLFAFSTGRTWCVFGLWFSPILSFLELLHVCWRSAHMNKYQTFPWPFSAWEFKSALYGSGMKRKMNEGVVSTYGQHDNNDIDKPHSLKKAILACDYMCTEFV